MADSVNFSSDFFKANRERLREKLGEDKLVIVTANGMLQRNSDIGFPFRQDSNFWYLTGIDSADVVLVMDGAEEYLIVPTRDEIHAKFDGVINPDKMSEISGVAMFYGLDEGWAKLAARIKDMAAVSVLDAPNQYIEGANMYTNPSRNRLIAQLKELHAGLKLEDIREQLMELRVIKQPIEIEAIQRAIDITVDSLQTIVAPDSFAGFAAEYELEAELTRLFRRQRSGHAFEPIVASGARACQLHYIDNDGLVEKDQLLIFDVGAEVSNYAADVARTYVSGQATGRQIAVYEAVCRVQDYAFSLLKPGISNFEYEKQVETYMGEQLRGLGLIKGDDSDDIRQYFPHMTSHFLGLDTHDVGDYREPLRAGMVLTCEPGIYIPEEGIGVRIEDDVLITESGCEVLSKRLPRSLSGQ